jgi:hypothetical protein
LSGVGCIVVRLVLQQAVTGEGGSWLAGSTSMLLLCTSKAEVDGDTDGGRCDACCGRDPLPSGLDLGLDGAQLSGTARPHGLHEGSIRGDQYLAAQAIGAPLN